jgi:hypothetical protein
VKNVAGRQRWPKLDEWLALENLEKQSHRTRSQASILGVF